MKSGHNTSIRKPLLIQLLNLIKCSIYTTFVLSLILIIFGLLWNLTLHERLESFYMIVYLMVFDLYVCYTVVPASILLITLLHHVRLCCYSFRITEITVFVNLIYFISFIIFIEYLQIKGISLIISFYFGTAIFSTFLISLYHIILKKINNKKLKKIKQVSDKLRIHRHYYFNKRIDAILIYVIMMVVILLILCNMNFLVRQ